MNKKHGFSLTETLLVLGVVAVGVTVAFIGYDRANTAATIRNEVASTNALIKDI